jgi:hypothetical protein
VLSPDGGKQCIADPDQVVSEPFLVGSGSRRLEQDLDPVPAILVKESLSLKYLKQNLIN